jgi:hypothetical protein
MPMPDEYRFMDLHGAALRRLSTPDGLRRSNPIGMPKPTEYAKREGLRALPPSA